MIGWAWRPKGVPAATSARRMSPVAMCGMWNRACSISAWVPFPLPGGPYMSRFMTELPDEAAVLAHHQLRLQLFHGVQRDAHDDQDRRASQVHLVVRYARVLGRGDGQDHGDEAQERGARERDPIHHRGEVVGRRLARSYARDEARIPFEVFGHVVHLERDRGVEVREGERE